MLLRIGFYRQQRSGPVSWEHRSVAASSVDNNRDAVEPTDRRVRWRLLTNDPQYVRRHGPPARRTRRNHHAEAGPVCFQAGIAQTPADQDRRIHPAMRHPHHSPSSHASTAFRVIPRSSRTRAPGDFSSRRRPRRMCPDPIRRSPLRIVSLSASSSTFLESWENGM